jgi:hypothetical protein
MLIIKNFRVLGKNPGFRHFGGVGDFRGFGSISQCDVVRNTDNERTNHHQRHLNLSLYPISYQGGAIIGVFMI